MKIPIKCLEELGNNYIYDKSAFRYLNLKTGFHIGYDRTEIIDNKVYKITWINKEDK